MGDKSRNKSTPTRMANSIKLLRHNVYGDEVETEQPPAKVSRWLWQKQHFEYVGDNWLLAKLDQSQVDHLENIYQVSLQKHGSLSDVRHGEIHVDFGQDLDYAFSGGYTLVAHMFSESMRKKAKVNTFMVTYGKPGPPTAKDIQGFLIVDRKNEDGLYELTTRAGFKQHPMIEEILNLLLPDRN